MRIYNLLIIIFLGLLFLSCDDEKTTHFELKIVNEDHRVVLGEDIKLHVNALTGKKIDQIQLNFQGKIFTANEDAIQLSTEAKKLGQHAIEAEVVSGSKSYTIENSILILNNAKPKVFGYEIVNTFPHDPNAYTQGLEFYQDTLYESTGQYRQSSLRKVNYQTGEVLQKVNLPDDAFGEGLSILNGKIRQLEWRRYKRGFTYRVSDLTKLGYFDYQESKEGWGLCNDGHIFYKSDGSDKIWLLDSQTMKELSYIQPTTHKATSTQLNELEWVEGKIYANTYQKDGVVIINPKNGAVEAIIDFRGLSDLIENPYKDVLNGIAYHAPTKRLFVTGKNWDKLFEVRVIQK